MELGKVGIWWSGTWSGADGAHGAAAAEMESLGYGALWCSGGFDLGCRCVDGAGQPWVGLIGLGEQDDVGTPPRRAERDSEADTAAPAGNHQRAIGKRSLVVGHRPPS